MTFCPTSVPLLSRQKNQCFDWSTDFCPNVLVGWASVLSSVVPIDRVIPIYIYGTEGLNQYFSLGNSHKLLSGTEVLLSWTEDLLNKEAA